MQRLSARHIGELAEELNPLFAGRELCSVQALPPRDLLLIFTVEEAGVDPSAGRPRAVRRMRLSVDPDAPRVHLQHGRVHKYEGPTGPFFVRLNEELAGLRLKRLQQVSGDRILRLEFDGDRRRALIAELGGRHGNLILLDGGGKVLDLLVPARPARSTDLPPRLVTGQAWARPPGQPPAESGPSLEEGLADAGAELPQLPVAAPLSRRVEAQLGGQAEDRDLERERRSLLQRLKRKLAGARGLLVGLEKRRVAAEGAERVRMDGELLKSCLGQFSRGAEFTEVPDWFEDGAPRRIALDPKLSPQENLKRIFRRYQKLARSCEAIDREQALAETRLQVATDLLARAETGDPRAIELEAIEAGVLVERRMKTHRDKQATSQRLPYRRFTGCRGSEIRVGRSARDNDRTNSRHSRGNDLWLHTRDAPGSHVILRLQRNAQPDPEEVLDAAHLALHFSPLKDARSGAVHVAARKHVHKPRGAPPGLVTLSGGRTIELRVEPERLERLLRSAERANRSEGAKRTD